ncbi:MAG: hypothetical protein ACRBDI_08025 [Alphaproteobacteria bacterium]
MGKIRDEYEQNANQEKSDIKSEAQQRKIKAKIRKEQNIADGDACEAQLRDLMSELRPMYDEVRKDWRTMFLMPNLSPLSIERSSKTDTPRLICRFGMRLDKESGGIDEKSRVRTVIQYDQNEQKYNLEHHIWQHPPSGGLNPQKPRTWRIRNDRRHSAGLFNKNEAVEKIRDELKEVYASHKREMPKRLGLGALTLAIAFGLSQCGNADAGEPNVETQEKAAHVVNTLENDL